MIFWILIILAIGFTVWAIVDDLEHVMPTALSVIFVIAAIISIIVLICSHTGLDGMIAENEARYEMLTYQLENDIYDNDNDLGKRELMEDIQEWNEDLAWYQANQDDFWIGIYIPDVFDQFEPVRLD